MNMNKRIRHYIKSKGMTFTAVADRTPGINIKKFSRFMSDKQQMTTAEYENICRHGLGIDPAYFFSEEFLETQNLTA